MPIKEQQFTPAIWFELKLAPKGTPIGYFTEVSGLSSEVEVMTYNEGGKNDGVHKFHAHEAPQPGAQARRDDRQGPPGVGPGLLHGSGAQGDHAHDVQRAAREAPDLELKGAYPVKWTWPFNAAQNTVVTEVIEIAHEGIQVS